MPTTFAAGVAQAMIRSSFLGDFPFCVALLFSFAMQWQIFRHAVANFHIQSKSHKHNKCG